MRDISSWSFSSLLLLISWSCSKSLAISAKASSCWLSASTRLPSVWTNFVSVLFFCFFCGGDDSDDASSTTPKEPPCPRFRSLLLLLLVVALALSLVASTPAGKARHSPAFLLWQRQQGESSPSPDGMIFTTLMGGDSWRDKQEILSGKIVQKTKQNKISNS